MKNSTKLSDAIHILTYIVINQGTDLSSTQIAKSVNSNPVVIRRIMAQLKNEGCLISSNGRANPQLARPADTISLLDIYRAVEEETDFLKIDTKTNPNCNIGRHIQTTLDKYYQQVQESAEKEMNKIKLSDIIKEIQSIQQ
ncbi:transcriptional regulator [Leuconostoc litchii]|uniref:Rrf2 family transcriptional regulator n=1 Tax=Leuconostoc litchii TaxID=1981069 RepID=A0A652NE69_9LACO|nr:Rrf2 family transcriptional regulator [Leuconostoc litchii]TYC46471.1 Rrf2 family transcriptional regulator [Leuconostoc litchii]GMA70219.1 transcriptional regulator [Leuconostoc litchii]